MPKKKNGKPKKNSVMDNVENNDYLKMCKQKRGRNKQVLSQIVDDLKRIAGKDEIVQNVLQNKICARKQVVQKLV